MASQENGVQNLSSDFDIEALINAADVELDDKAVSEVVSSLHQELKSVNKESSPQEGSSSSCNDTDQIKTKGEASNLTLNLSSSSKPPDERRASLSTMSPFAALTPHSPHVQLLTSDEQSAIYKQASLLAIYAMSNKNGATKAKEMLAVVTKVKNFLTNLVQLAGNSGPQVKATVHSLVQKLVSGSITEKEFAEKIEQDLKSKHQPDLLPFLQSSIPELRTHLQIQKEYMKQLVDKKVQEKQQTVNTSSVAVTTPTVTTPTSANNDTTKVTGQSPGKPSGGGVMNLTAMGVSLSQQQALRAHLANLPEDQRKAALEKFIYNKQLQLLIQKQKSTLKAMNPTTVSTATSLPPSLPPSSTATTATKLTATQQQLSVILRQQQRIKEQQAQASLALGGISPQRNSPRKTGLTSLIVKQQSHHPDDTTNVGSPPPTKGGRLQDDEEEDDTVENIAGVNLKEETAHFLPTSVSTSSHSCTDETFLSLSSLKSRVQSLGYRYGIIDASDEYLTFLSHATEERLRNIIEQITAVSQHRSELLKDDMHYDTSNDVRGQLKILERIDEISSNRKQEREKEKILRVAKSRSKQDDPEIAKMKEQAKQIQIAEEREIHQKAANTLALAAIGRRKRTATTAFGASGGDTISTSVSSGGLSSSATPNTLASVFNTPGTSRVSNRSKARRLLTKDVLLTMEQDKDTRHSILVYKTLIN